VIFKSHILFRAECDLLTLVSEEGGIDDVEGPSKTLFSDVKTESLQG
jgi:hypothetical protein